MDYYSDYYKLDLLEQTTVAAVINVPKSNFARHGLADMVTDNGPQYSSEEFSAFSREWDFVHPTSSSLHSQSNGKVESTIKIAKKLIKRPNEDDCDQLLDDLRQLEIWQTRWQMVFNPSKCKTICIY